MLQITQVVSIEIQLLLLTQQWLGLRECCLVTELLVTEQPLLSLSLLVTHHRGTDQGGYRLRSPAENSGEAQLYLS